MAGLRAVRRAASGPLQRAGRGVLVLAGCMAGANGCSCEEETREQLVRPGSVSTAQPAPRAKPPPYYLRELATSGDTTLVVWRASGKDRGIRAIRLDSTGALLDRAPLELSTDPHDTDVDVAAYEGGFWVVWEHFPKGKGVHIQGVRVSVTGEILDGTPVALSGPDETQRSPSIACVGSGCLLVYHDYRTGSYGSLRGVRLQDGKPAEPDWAFVGKSHGSSAAAATPAGYLVALNGGLTQSQRNVSTVLVPLEKGAAASEPKRLAEQDRGRGIQIACHAERCFAAWLGLVKTSGGPRHREVEGTRVYITPTRTEIWGCALEGDGARPEGTSPQLLRKLDSGQASRDWLVVGAGPSGFAVSWQAVAYGEDGSSSAGVLQIGAEGAAPKALSPPTGETSAGKGGRWLAALARPAKPRDSLLVVRLGENNQEDWAAHVLPGP